MKRLQVVEDGRALRVKIYGATYELLLPVGYGKLPVKKTKVTRKKVEKKDTSNRGL